MNKAKINDIVQITKGEWIGCLVHVTELKRFGIVGFVHIPLKKQAPIRINEEDYEVIGPAVIMPNEI